MTTARRRVGVRLRCGVAGPLLGVDLASLGSGPVPLNDLVGTPARLATRQLADNTVKTDNTDASAAELAIVRGPVRTLATTADRPDPLVLAFVRLSAHPGARVDLVAERLGVSERALRRRVRPSVGIGPKQLQRVPRFGVFTRRLDALATGHRTLAETASTLGYADQSHLGRDCVVLAGAAPGALVRSWSGGDRNIPDRSGPAAASWPA